MTQQENPTSSQPRLVITKYSANWCAPCKALATSLEFELQKRNNGVSFVLNNVNIEDSPEEAALAGVRAVPTVVVWDNDLNTEVHRFIGNKGLVEVKAMLDTLGVV